MRGTKNSGFTLVELIVVITILAILAAIMVPNVMGYIEKAKQKQYMLDAKSAMNAIQAALIEEYAARSSVMPDKNSIIGYMDKKDVSWMGKAFAQNILETAEVNPYMLIVGLGEYGTYKSISLRKAYTVYFIAYWPEKDAMPIFFDGTTWTEEYPWEGQYMNTFMVGGNPVNMQFYFVAGPSTNMGTNWIELQKKVGVLK